VTAETDRTETDAELDQAAPEGCPDENALAEFVQGLGDERAAAEIELHLDDCAACRRIISSLGRSSYLAERTRTEVGSGDPSWSIGSQASREYQIPEPGEVLAGKYRIERLLGQGGMGVVMAATHLNLGKLVALKLMRADLVVDQSATHRFVREARAASLLRSEHIARVIDLDTLADGTYYIAMEYLDGEDLGAVLARRGALDANEAAIYIVQVCEAVAEAHAAGIVHRDLKPANLFLTMRGASPCVKVLDFGISKIIAHGALADDVASTDTKAIVGSPHYMAPEQLISAKLVDPRTDVWSLGCILFELVTGRLPFTGDALAPVLASILRDDVPPLQDLRPDLPPGFSSIVACCLDKDPARRFQRVDELATALTPYVAGVQLPGLPAAAHPAAPPAGPEPAPARASRWWLAAVAVALTGALALAGYHAARSGARAPEHPAGATPAASAPAEAAPAPASTPAQPSAPEPAQEQSGAVPELVPAELDAAVDQPEVEASPAPASPGARRRPSRRPSRLEDDLIGPPVDR
jgi:eukaryotic-like serine/threonine-protein kinase